MKRFLIMIVILALVTGLGWMVYQKIRESKPKDAGPKGNPPVPVEAAKVQKAAAYYRRKYGRPPDLCLVNPGMLDRNGKGIAVAGLTVRPYRPVLPGHLWIGFEDQN